MADSTPSSAEEGDPTVAPWNQAEECSCGAPLEEHPTEQEEENEKRDRFTGQEGLTMRTVMLISAAAVGVGLATWLVPPRTPQDN